VVDFGSGVGFDGEGEIKEGDGEIGGDGRKSNGGY